MQKRFNRTDTSWQKVSPWYKKHVGIEGSYFHQHVVIPKTLKILNLDDKSSLLDLGCGQGILARSIRSTVYYQGIDLSYSLINYAKVNDKNPNHHYTIGDFTKPLSFINRPFSHAVIVLALQNTDSPDLIIKNSRKYLDKGGKLVIILNHPCFRIPRQSGWSIDEKNKLQYRKINLYMTPLKIPVTAHPSLGAKSPVSWSFHFPISYYCKNLMNNGFYIKNMEEWISDKMSTGPSAGMENRARAEFPLFLAISAVRI
jgi:ubiquinone/menaquinone biosynthesis C-methylase UbiE